MQSPVRLIFIACFLSIFMLLTCNLPFGSLYATQNRTLELNKLQQRAEDYWKHKVDMELQEAYSYEDPQSLNGTSLSQYVRTIGSGSKWLGATIEDASFANETGHVTVRIRYRVSFIPPTQQPKDGFVNSFTEEWVHREGTWYHLFNPSLLKFSREKAPQQSNATRTESSPL